MVKNEKGRFALYSYIGDRNARSITENDKNYNLSFREKLFFVLQWYTAIYRQFVQKYTFGRQIFLYHGLLSVSMLIVKYCAYEFYKSFPILSNFQKENQVKIGPDIMIAHVVQYITVDLSYNSFFYPHIIIHDISKV